MRQSKQAEQGGGGGDIRGEVEEMVSSRGERRGGDNHREPRGSRGWRR